MNKIAREVRSYWFSQSPYLMWDPITLDNVIKTLSPHEMELLDKGVEDCDYTEMDDYTFTMNRVFNRHNDIICGWTTIEDGKVVCTEKSSITELDISLSVLKDCNRHCVYHVADVEDTMPGFSFESAVELTAAIIKYNQTHSDLEKQVC